MASTAVKVQAIHQSRMDTHRKLNEKSFKTIRISNFKFEPSEIRIPCGGTVKWVFTSEDVQSTKLNEELHQLSWQENINNDQNCSLHNSKVLRPGSTFIQRFDTPGSHKYYCSLYTFMNGVVIVDKPLTTVVEKKVQHQVKHMKEKSEYCENRSSENEICQSTVNVPETSTEQKMKRKNKKKKGNSRNKMKPLCEPRTSSICTPSSSMHQLRNNAATNLSEKQIVKKLNKQRNLQHRSVSPCSTVSSNSCVEQKSESKKKTNRSRKKRQMEKSPSHEQLIRMVQKDSALFKHYPGLHTEEKPEDMNTVNKSNANLRTYNISVKNFKFYPATVTIRKGGIIKWVVNDVNQLHRIQGLGEEQQSKWESPVFGHEESFEKQFMHVGSFKYSCKVYPWMHGTIKVINNNNRTNGKQSKILHHEMEEESTQQWKKWEEEDIQMNAEMRKKLRHRGTIVQTHPTKSDLKLVTKTQTLKKPKNTQNKKTNVHEDTTTKKSKKVQLQGNQDMSKMKKITESAGAEAKQRTKSAEAVFNRKATSSNEKQTRLNKSNVKDPNHFRESSKTVQAAAGPPKIQPLGKPASIGKEKRNRNQIHSKESVSEGNPQPNAISKVERTAKTKQIRKQNGKIGEMKTTVKGQHNGISKAKAKKQSNTSTLQGLTKDEHNCSPSSDLDSRLRSVELNQKPEHQTKKKRKKKKKGKISPGNESTTNDVKVLVDKRPMPQYPVIESFDVVLAQSYLSEKWSHTKDNKSLIWL